MGRQVRKRGTVAAAAVATMAVVLLSVAPVDAETVAATGSGGQVKNFQHVFVIMMENTGYGGLIGNSAAPWINSAAASYGLASNYYGVTHPSQPNYIAATSGLTSTGNPPQNPLSNADETIDAANLVDQLEGRGKTWRAYMESYADAIRQAPATLADPKLVSEDPNHLYERKHNPFVSYRDVQINPARMAKVVDLGQLATDLASGNVADLVWISPNQCNDMHNVIRAKAADPSQIPFGCDPNDLGPNGPIRLGDQFLRATVGQIMSSPAWLGNSLIVIAWDESDVDPYIDLSGCCSDSPDPVVNPTTGVVTAGGGGGHVVALTISQSQDSPRVSNVAYDHYSLLRTIEDGWALGTLGNAANRTPMTDLVGPSKARSS